MVFLKFSVWGSPNSWKSWKFFQKTTPAVCALFQIPRPRHPHPAHAKRLNRANMSDYIGPPQSLDVTSGSSKSGFVANLAKHPWTKQGATRIVHIEYTNFLYNMYIYIYTYIWLRSSIHISYNIVDTYHIIYMCIYIYIFPCATKDIKLSSHYGKVQPTRARGRRLLHGS